MQTRRGSGNNTMSSLEKAKQELLKCSKNYTYDKARALLKIHKPHPGNTMDTGAVKDLIKKLQDYGEL